MGDRFPARLARAIGYPDAVAADAARATLLVDGAEVVATEEGGRAILQAMSGVCSQLAGGASLGDVAAVPDSYEMRKAARGCTVLEFLETECGLTVSQDAKNSWSYANRLAVIAQLKTVMDNANTTSQEDAIELQSMVNWRDVTFNASSGVVARYGNSGMNMAGNI